MQEVLGHKDFKMTLRYANLSPQHLHGAVERPEGLTPTVTAKPPEATTLSLKPGQLAHDMAHQPFDEAPARGAS